MSYTLTVRNAYGRDFKSKKEILDHYNSNKDFQNLNPIFYKYNSFNERLISTGAIVNKEDAKRFKVGYLRVRYDNLRKVQTIDVKKGNFQ